MDETDCSFCAYARGDAVPESGIERLGETIVFEPLRPFAPGHVLVVPVQHHESIRTAPPELIGEVMIDVSEVAGGIVAELADGVNIITSVGEAATQTVMHWHVHVIPRRAGDQLGGWPWKPPEPPSTGLVIHYEPPVSGGCFGPGHLQEAYDLGKRSRR